MTQTTSAFCVHKIPTVICIDCAPFCKAHKIPLYTCAECYQLVYGNEERDGIRESDEENDEDSQTNHRKKRSRKNKKGPSPNADQYILKKEDDDGSKKIPTQIEKSLRDLNTTLNIIPYIPFALDPIPQKINKKKKKKKKKKDKKKDKMKN
ncbi:hypothetical protein ScalyP_jg3487 [Parmales sp. scaly parma]|nr:hypothetical protein ScalyP_jg3487 [Parmales sp. scaly parma]